MQNMDSFWSFFGKQVIKLTGKKSFKIDFQNFFADKKATKKFIGT